MNTKYWIALEQSQGIGPAHLKEIHDTLSKLDLSIVDLFDLTGEEIEEEFHFNSKLVESICNARDVLNEIEDDYFAMIDAGINIIPFFSSDYPERLTKIMGNSFPPILYTFGNKKILKEGGIAILGDKNISDRGELIAYGAARELARHRITTISGFANGVGLVSHRAAIENGGNTIAVVPYGIKHFKPPEFIREVMDPDKIIIVSPFYPSREVNKFNAFIRNKIICALSYAVYIVEAPADGGIFEAAKSAHKLKIPLFTTRYGNYPENALGNPKIMEEFNGEPIQRKKDADTPEPNMDRIIALAKFGE